AGLLALAGVLGVGEGHLLHRKALRVKSADFAKSGSLFQSFPSSECLAQILFLCLTKSMRRFLGGSFSWAGSFEPESMNVFLPAFQNLVGGGIERSH
ncbi:hypothetical protein, partial [Pseudomonas aeruginosa]|uniref:hypothetical protein n=1 Tax=Pseudomonas aeruginosa TaxID=287 RepID=UPI003FD536B2